MKVQGLDGKTYVMNLQNKRVFGSYTRPRSTYHIKAKNLLTNIFPYDNILEEVALPGTRLSIDFFLPQRKLMIEVQGSQHMYFNKLFHGEIDGFINSLKRDSIKKQWCELNKLIFVELIWNENESQWKNKILKA